MKTSAVALALLQLFLCSSLSAQIRLPDSGQTQDFTSTFGEDSDYLINPPRYTDLLTGIVADVVTGLFWQKVDGGEMTFAQADSFARTLQLGGNQDWRLPTAHELFSMLNHGTSNPAMDKTFFPASNAEYWWTSEHRADDATRVWVVNAGGGIGAHPMSETISAGGTKRFHVRCVRGRTPPPATGAFIDNGDGTVTDGRTGLMWRNALAPDSLTWEDALRYCENLSAAGYSDWRMPNVKELHSLSSTAYVKPCFAPAVLPSLGSCKIWSSTTLINQTTRAWDLESDFGIVSYTDKASRLRVLCVRGGAMPSEVSIPGGEFEMGDHFGFVDPSHPSDELPIHRVRVDAFSMATTETTNQEFLAFLNGSLLTGVIEVRGNAVYPIGGNMVYCYTHQYAPYYSIGYDGHEFSIVDFRAKHPVVGVMWEGAAAYCNWLSAQNGRTACYDTATWACDFTKNGYRLPTEAEWEYAAHGGKTTTYFNYPWGDDQDISKANWPESQDPYEGTTEASYPNTTPVGFYDGRLHLKSEFNWPGLQTSYQTSNGANALGLYDMAGNVWEFVNDWYGNSYYGVSPYDNPRGPDAGFIMPDGKPYRGMRGGNWYNGYRTTGVNDGHSRVSNRNPSYYRGPQDPNHPWYHVGFRVARSADSGTTGTNDVPAAPPQGFNLYQNHPNPFNPATTITYSIPNADHVVIKIYDAMGRELTTLVDQFTNAGNHEAQFDGRPYRGGVLYCRMDAGGHSYVRSMIMVK